MVTRVEQPAAEQAGRPESQAERWAALHELDEWLRTPMLVLSFVWLGIVIYELAAGSSKLLETFGTAIWLIFLAEFAIRLTLAPEKVAFLRSNCITVVALAVPALRLFRAV